MRGLYNDRKFFSFYEHLEPSQIQELIRGSDSIVHKLERDMKTNGFIPYVSMMVRRRQENEEAMLNGIIGIA